MAKKPVDHFNTGMWTSPWQQVKSLWNISTSRQDSDYSLEIFGDVAYGTTNIDFSQSLADELYRVRSYRPAWLKVAQEQVQMSTSAGARLEKKIWESKNGRHSLNAWGERGSGRNPYKAGGLTYGYRFRH